MKITKKNLKDIELYLAPQQKDSWITGHELYQHLKDENLLEDCLTLENLQEIQSLGVEEFNKYFKDKFVFAWNSVQDQNGGLDVPSLIESGGEVVVHWHWLGNDWDSHDPALRFSKSSKLKSSEPLDPLSSALPDVLIINNVRYVKE